MGKGGEPRPGEEPRPGQGEPKPGQGEPKPSDIGKPGELRSTILDAIRGNIEELKAMAARLEGADPEEGPGIDYYAKNTQTPFSGAQIDTIE